MESRYSYAPAVYNSFPWPDISDAQKKNIEKLSQSVLDVRDSFKGINLETLYDRDSMPPALRKAHDALDQAVDRLYRRGKFRFERERVEHLFELFNKEAAPLDTTEEPKPRRKKKVK